LRSFVDWAVGEHIPVVLFGKELREIVVSRDYVRKDVGKALADVGKSVDWYGKTASFIRTFVDAGKVADYLSKGVLSILLDEVSGEYYHAKGVLKIHEDAGKSADWHFKFTVKTLAETAVPCDYMYKDVLKLVVDVGEAIDYLEKTPTKRLVDTGKVADWYSRIKFAIRTFTDVGVVSEIIVKDVLRVFADWAVGEHAPAIWPSKALREIVVSCDYVRKDVLKAAADAGVPCDYLEKAPLKALLDACKAVDWYSKGVARTFEYEAPSTGWIEKTAHYYRSLADVVVPCDWRGAFDILRSFKELVIARDMPARAISLVLVDTLVGEYSLTKGWARVVRDKGKPRDLVTKIAYKIYGHDVYRRYIVREWLLHERRELIDYIMPEDHNVRILVCRALLEAMRRLHDKLKE